MYMHRDRYRHSKILYRRCGSLAWPLKRQTLSKQCVGQNGKTESGNHDRASEAAWTKTYDATTAKRQNERNE